MRRRGGGVIGNLTPVTRMRSERAGKRKRAPLSFLRHQALSAVLCHGEELCPPSQIREQLAPRPSQPCLCAEGADLVGQCGAPSFVEMSGDLVEQEKRRSAEIL